MDEEADHSILQRLYDSGINACIEWMWDGGVEWSLGDDYRGWRVSGRKVTIALAVVALAKAAAQNYPRSDFAAWWRAR